MRLYSVADTSGLEHKYAIQMAPQGKGYALFDPYPGQYRVDDQSDRFVRNPCVEIGDVGYIFRGSFHLLFNVHREAEDPLQIHGVPRGYAPLRRQERLIDRRFGPFPRVMHSSSSIAVDLGSGVSVPGIASVEATWDVQHERGATLAYLDSHEIWDAQNKESYRRYFRNNYKSWIDFVNWLEIGLNLKDLVLVTGCDRTRAWATLYNESHSIGGGLKLEVQTSIGPSVSLAGSVKWRNAHSIPSLSGPPADELASSIQTLPVPADQCIFIRGYQGNPLFPVAPSKLKAAAGPHDLPRADEDGDNYQAPVQDDASIDEGSMEVEELLGTPSSASGSLLSIALPIVMEYYMPTCEDDILLMHDDELRPFLPKPGEHVPWDTVEDVKSHLRACFRSSHPQCLRPTTVGWEQREELDVAETGAQSERKDAQEDHGHPKARSRLPRIAPGSPGGKSAPLPPVVVDHPPSSGSASSSFIVKTSSPLEAVHTLSPSPQTWTPSSKAWWHERDQPTSRPWSEGPKRQKTVRPEQTENYLHTKERVIEATASVLGAGARVTHEALFTGVELLDIAPLPALESAGAVLLDIWEAVEMIEMNRLACLRLTERCAETLISVREESQLATVNVAHELQGPIDKLQSAFKEVHVFLQKQLHRPFLHRYVKRDDTLRSISHCDASLNDALDAFSMRVHIRILELVEDNEARRQQETGLILGSLGLESLPSTDRSPLAPGASTITTTPSDGQGIDDLKDLQEAQKLLHSYRRKQDSRDRVDDMADLRQLMRTALQTNDDAMMIEVLQIACDEMPEAIKTLQCALERELERERYPNPNVATLAQQKGGVEPSGLDTISETSGQPVSDTLDREFIEAGIDALRRLSQGTDLVVPSWTITRYEVELDEKIGIGFFSDVYKGQWRDNTVAIKVLAETTPRKLFVREIGIWKKLDHPNVLELLGASSTTCDPPWFLVSPYYQNGNLVGYLRGLGPDAPVDALKMMHQITKGMSYLHGKGILHGDLKGANVLVDDRLHCVISDFGQSEMKSEVFRLSRQPTPHATLRWQSPELMRGAIDGLTPGVDVYAFGILCVEILSQGALPWPMSDDETVRRFVINENMRPSLPSHAPEPLKDIIQSAWDSDPLLRPTFLKIERDLRTLRRQAGALPDSPPTRTRISDSSSSVTWYEPATSQLDEEFPAFEQGGLSKKSTISKVQISAMTTDLKYDSVHDSAAVQESMLDSEPDFSSMDPNSAASQFMNERRYRMLLRHDYHATLSLPLWTPTQVRLAAVGYTSKPEGSFVTLFNSMDKLAPDGSLVDFPGLSEYGRVATASTRFENRNAAERGIDMVRSFLSSRRKVDDRPAVSRTQTFQLRAGQKAAHLYAESTVCQYMEDVNIPKRWFEANIDGILEKYGRDHNLTRGDVFLVIGTLEAQDYAMFVSHTHPDGQINFNIFSDPRPGDPWGEFVPTAVAGPSPSLVGPSHDNEAMGTMRWAHKVSRSKGPRSTDGWDSVLLARLRFKPDASEPTRL